MGLTRKQRFRNMAMEQLLYAERFAMKCYCGLTRVELTALGRLYVAEYRLKQRLPIDDKVTQSNLERGDLLATRPCGDSNVHPNRKCGKGIGRLTAGGDARRRPVSSF